MTDFISFAGTSDNGMALSAVFSAIVMVSVLSSGMFGLKREPECSRFHYEEQLLDKMIRTEIKFEEMQKLVTETLKQINDILAAFQKTNDDFIQDKTEELNTQRESVHKALTELESVKDGSVTPTIGFNVRTVADTTLDSSNQKLIFTHIELNLGNGYDTLTGIFTAPTEGTYLFTVHLCIYTGKFIQYGIMVEDNAIIRGVNYDTDTGYPCSSVDTIVVLKASERVWVQSFHTGDRLQEDSLRWNAFSGVLLK